MLLTWFIALVYPNIDKVISIMGGLLATTLDYAIPTFCYVKLSNKKWNQGGNLAATLFYSTLCCIGWGSVGITVYLMVTGGDIMPRVG